MRKVQKQYNMFTSIKQVKIQNLIEKYRYWFKLNRRQILLVYQQGTERIKIVRIEMALNIHWWGGVKHVSMTCTQP